MLPTELWREIIAWAVGVDWRRFAADAPAISRVCRTHRDAVAQQWSVVGARMTATAFTRLADDMWHRGRRAIIISATIARDNTLSFYFDVEIARFWSNDAAVLNRYSTFVRRSTLARAVDPSRDLALYDSDDIVSKYGSGFTSGPHLQVAINARCANLLEHGATDDHAVFVRRYRRVVATLCMCAARAVCGDDDDDVVDDELPSHWCRVLRHCWRDGENVATCD